MLWFYLHKQSCPRPIKSEKEICQDFLNSKFKPTDETKEIYVLNEKGVYESKPVMVNFPAKNFLLLKEAIEIYSRVNEKETMGQIFEKCGISVNFSKVNLIRACLATSGSPYLEVIT